ncbi:hypothetical protein BOX15_Mlig024290g2 [Macrostomum lignano]|uniref:Peptidase M13 C-terminal domain-containing protein n=1 Tax=Macrostomum lignano TaxID=282301 RepID=A0A267FED5_9PLAT|nr:hypothetical protein BOX15_Mlig024290g2 [Macrostomum lignano]
MIKMVLSKMALPRLLLLFALLGTTGVSADLAKNFTTTALADDTQPAACQTPACLSLAAQLTRHMNLSADPCEDFNAFACGNYAASSLYDPGTVTWSEYTDEPSAMHSGVESIRSQMDRRVFELLYARQRVNSSDPDVNLMYDLARDLFSSCSIWVRRRGKLFKDPNSGREASKDFFDGLLAHLFDDINRQESNASFETALAKMVRLGVWQLIEVGSAFSSPYFNPGGSSRATERNGSKVRLTVNLYRYSEDVSFNDYLKFFWTVPSASVLSFQSAQIFSSILDELKANFTLEEDVPEEEIKHRWANCSVAEEILENGGMDVTVSQLDGLSKCASPKDPFSWSSFFDGVLDGSVSPETPIQIRAGRMSVLAYAGNVIDTVTYFKTRTFIVDSQYSPHFSFLILNWLLSFAKYLPADLRVKWLSQHRASSDVMELNEDPISSCMQLTKVVLGPVIERMYQQAYHSEYFDDVRSLVELVQNATIENVLKQEWITQNAKDSIVDKVLAMRQEIGFNAVPADQIKEFYSSTIRSLRVSNNSKTFGATVALSLCAHAGRLNNLLSRGGDNSASFFRLFSGLIVNAFSRATSNQIIFPMGILAPFLYHRSYPDHFNLGGIGVVIGHEIGHGFDKLGHRLNKQGARGHFWDNVTEAGYVERMRCVSERYSGYEFLPGIPHNSKLTLSNDISDLMGIQSAFAAMQMRRRLNGDRTSLRLPNLPVSLTPDRLFFVQAAQAYCTKAEPEVLLRKFRTSRHSPPHIRIRGMMENSLDFARVFQCQPNQPMNPSKKCVFW